MKQILLVILLLMFSLASYPQDFDEMASNEDKKTDIKKSKKGGFDSLSSDTSDIKKEDESEKSPVEEKRYFLNGYVKANLYFIRSKDTYGDKKIRDSKIGATSQLRFEGDIPGRAHFFTSFNLEYNQADSDSDTNPELKPRIVEAYVDLYFNWLTIRAGHQLVTWGKTDGFDVPTDNVCPKDFSYQSTEYEDLKLGVTALRLNIFFIDQKLELFWIPLFQPHILATDTASEYTFRYHKPTYSIDNSEIAVQISGNITGIDYAFNYLFAFDDLPDIESFDTTTAPYTINFHYQRVHIPGFDFSFPISSILVKGSYALFYTKDWQGDDPVSKNSYMKYLIGIEYIKGSSSIAMQVGQRYVISHIAYHDMVGKNFLLLFDQEDEFQNIVTGTINLSFFPGDALNLKALFTLKFNNYGENWSYAVQPVLTYKIADGVDVILGAAFVSQMNIDKAAILFETKYSF